MDQREWWNMLRIDKRDDRGVSAILVALCLVLVLGLAAIAIDIGFGMNERRGDIAAADLGVMAGATSTLGTNAQVRDQILAFTRSNLDTAYTNAAWQALWEGCLDTERAGLNASGHNFITVPSPAGWSVTRVDCISIDPAGFVRVRVPNQLTKTIFAPVVGVSQISTNADAIARWNSRAEGGILPFGVLGNAGDGSHVCLRDAAGGIAEEPCDGTDAGNFGAIESPLYGNVELGTTQNCNGSPKNEILAINIALGLDHRVLPDTNGNPGDEVLDTCPVINSGFTPDTINTFTGISGGLEEGLATGPVPGGFTPRLQSGPNPKVTVFGERLDNWPLWEYIDTSLSSPAIPAHCQASTFDNTNPANTPFDWNSDGVIDLSESWEHMGACLLTYAGNSSLPTLFVEDLKFSPRFAYVPQFWETSFGAGNSWRHILRYKSTWLQATWWKKGATTVAFHPGEGGSFGGSNYDLIQLSGILLPDHALPVDLRGSSAFGGVEPFIPELYR